VNQHDYICGFNIEKNLHHVEPGGGGAEECVDYVTDAERRMRGLTQAPPTGQMRNLINYLTYNNNHTFISAT